MTEPLAAGATRTEPGPDRRTDSAGQPTDVAGPSTATDVTGLPTATDVSAFDRVAADAVRAAEAAAAAAGVRVRPLTTPADFDGVYRLYADIWRPDPTNPPMTTEQLRALGIAGSYVAGAFDVDTRPADAIGPVDAIGADRGGRLIAACVGFFGAPATASLHSHIAGVSTTARGRSVGFALKLHQRAWAMLRGVATVTWTVDPLVRRNAYFNLVKLAARPQDYLPNFYGGMHDAVNGDDDSDRLLMRWPLRDPAVAAACAGTGPAADADALRADGAAVALGMSALGGPKVGALDSSTLLVAIPPDIESLRGTDPGSAKDWRIAVREVLGSLLGDGARVTGFDRAGWYVLQRPTSAPAEHR